MGKGGWLQGKSIIDLLWDDLDGTMDILMDECESCDVVAGGHTVAYELQGGHTLQAVSYVLEYSVEEYRGRAQGVAYALALMSNPYLKDVNEVRALAKERWEQREAGETVTPLRTRPDLNVGSEA